MKKMKLSPTSLLILSVCICGLLFTNCGGGGSGSSLKKNEYLGNLPAIYDGYALKSAAMEKKIEEETQKLMAGGEKNFAKAEKMFDEYRAKEKELKEKFKADVQAETAKLVGKEVPVNYSEGLKNSGKHFYNISDIKLIDEKGDPKISFIVTAKDDFSVPSMKSYDYMIYYRLTSKDGALVQSTSTLIPVPLAREEQSFKKDFQLNQFAVGFNLSRHAADLATFSGLEFISKDEYDAAK